MAALRRVLMRTALPLAEAFLDCRTIVRVSVILSLICVFVLELLEAMVQCMRRR